jgi:hypothetical protein
MRTLLKTLFFFLLTTQFCSGQWMTSESDSLIQQVIFETNLDTMNYYLKVLTGVDSVTIGGNRYLITTRHANYAENNLAADFIYQTLSQTGLPTFNDNYSSTGRNVYSVQTGTDFPDKEFIICAHYDDMPSSWLAPGADDNASGVAAVLEAARVISQIQTKYTIIYALWDEEEVGLIGSANYANKAYTSGEDIIGVINLDMIGWDSNNDNTFDLRSGPVGNSLDLGRLGSAIANYFDPTIYGLLFTQAGGGSDHISFWNKGYSAMAIEEESLDFNPYYHTSNDNLNHFKFDYFYKMSKLSSGTMMFLGINGLTEGNINSSISSLDRTYARIGEDSVLFRIDFPESDPSQNFDAHLICSKLFGDVIDSLTLFDDGQHQDSLAGDGIYGVYILPQSTEDIFTLAVSTIDQNTFEYHNITQWVLFTTVGPVNVDSVWLTRDGLNHYNGKIFLKNESTSKTIEYASVKLKSSDSWVNNVYPTPINISNIGPGGSVTTTFYVNSLDSLLHQFCNLEIEILSYGFSFWKHSQEYPVGIEEEEILIPFAYSLEQNYPNPFNPSTLISYQLPVGGNAAIKVYDVLGNEIATLVDEYKPAGKYELEFNAEKLASGIYFYQLKAGDFLQTRKMLLIK